MPPLRCLEHLILSLLVFTPLTSGYDASSNTNIAMYFGQGPGESELGLTHFCESSGVDIIPLGFMNRYLAQANGYPGTNFGSSCFAENFTAPGYNGVNDPALNDLQSKCPSMVSGIPHCQSLGKKILLSLGGQVVTYALTSVEDAEYMADFLWGAFGPLNPSGNWPRPFDTEGVVNEVDGFDFDIEHVNTGEQEYYIILITRLRSYFPLADKQYIITGAPQCLFPDLQMGDIINQVQFDILFVQYYNTPQCSAREWVSSNPGFGISTNIENSSGFKKNFDALVTSLPVSMSKDTRVYIGLLGSTSAGTSGDYLDPASEVAPLIKAHFCSPYFGGIMIFDAGHSEQNVGADGKPFYEEIKDILVSDSTDTKAFVCGTTATPTIQGIYPTGERVTTITMTLCPTALGSFSTPFIYANSSSYSTTLSPITVTSTTVSSLRPTGSSSKTTTVATESPALYDTQIVNRMIGPGTTYVLDSSSTIASNSKLANQTVSTESNTGATPTYSFNLSAPSATSGSNCFIAVVTMTVPVSVVPCTNSPPVTASGSTPLSIGSRLFFVFSVGVPGTFGVFWYILGRIVL